MGQFAIAKYGGVALLLALLYLDHCNSSALPMANIDKIDYKPINDLFGREVVPDSSPNSCGGVIKSADEATIYYKLFDHALPNERCVWVIASPSATEYQVEAHVGSPSDDKLLVIGGVNHAKPKSMIQVYPNSGVQVNVKAQVLTVTFHAPSDPNDAKGFVLNVREVSTSDSTIINLDSQFQLVEYKNGGSPSIIAHPSTPGKDYGNNELSVFAFPPKDNIVSGQRRALTYKLIGLETSTPWENDYVYVYQFNASQQRWFLTKEIGHRSDYVQISGDDLILVVFRSDRSVTDRGFLLIEDNKMECH